MLEKQNIPKTVLPEKNTELTNTLDRITLSKYTIYLYLQYSKQEDVSLIGKLRDFLKSKGYVVPGMEKVKSESRDIRYFHEEDKDTAENLKKHVDEFIRNVSKSSNINLEVKDLGSTYPNAPKRVIELWLYF